MRDRTIHGGTDWYAERPERERSWSGLLRRREPPVGPDARAALTYVLITAEGEYNVYAANADAILAPLAGRPVVGQGKLVHLRGEGRGEELWLAFIRAAGSSGE